MGHSPLIVSTVPYRGVVTARVVIRHKNFESLVLSRAVGDPHVAMREEWEGLLQHSDEVNELALLPDEVIACIFESVGPFTHGGLCLAATHRRLRRLLLVQHPPITVSVVPHMLPLAHLERDAVLTSLAVYFSTRTRGQQVRQLCLMEQKHAACLPLVEPYPVVCLPRVLTMIAEMPYLHTLDLRGVRWEGPANRGAVSGFLSDLHLVAPKLKSLNVGVGLCRSWGPGWWQRHPELSSLVVSSRREEASSQAAPLELPDDFFVMLSSEGRGWQVKLWCPVEAKSMRRLLLPAAPLPGLRELTINLLGNAEVCGLPEAPAVADAADAKKMKGKRHVPGVEVGDVLLFPALVSLTVANVDERPVAAVEVLSRFTVVAPGLVNYSVCNTARVPPAEKPKNRRRGQPAPGAA